jgi:hypothetical protein
MRKLGEAKQDPFLEAPVPSRISSCKRDPDSFCGLGALDRNRSSVSSDAYSRDTGRAERLFPVGKVALARDQASLQPQDGADR